MLLQKITRLKILITKACTRILSFCDHKNLSWRIFIKVIPSKKTI